MPATDADNKALTGVKTTLMYKPEYPNSGGLFGTVSANPADTSPRWPGYVQSFGYTVNRDIAMTYGMGSAEGTQRADPTDQEAGKTTYDWSLDIVPQVPNSAESPYYDLAHLWASFHGSSLVVGSATTTDALGTGATTTDTERHYVSFYEINFVQEGTTLNARTAELGGCFASDFEISCEVGGHVEVSLSGQALSLATGISDNWGSTAHSSYATAVTTQGIHWTDTKVRIGGNYVPTVSRWSGKDTLGIGGPYHRITSNATTTTNPWAMSEQKNSFEVSITMDFDNFTQLNALLNGTKQDVHIELGSTEHLRYGNVLWSGTPVNADMDSDELIQMELTGSAESVSRVQTT